MRTRLALAVTTAAMMCLAAPSQARGPAPQIIDPAGDANGLSTVLPYSNMQTPAVSQADADVTSVLWRVVKDKKKKVIGFTVQARLSAAPRVGTAPRDGTSVVYRMYRMLGTPACGGGRPEGDLTDPLHMRPPLQFGVIYNSNPDANPAFGPRSAVRDTCTPSGEVRDTAIPLPKIVGSTMTWTVPLTAIPWQVNIVAGTTITGLRFGVDAEMNLANLGFETYLPVLDDGTTKTAFTFG